MHTPHYVLLSGKFSWGWCRQQLAFLSAAYCQKKDEGQSGHRSGRFGCKLVHSSCCVRIQSRCWGVDLLERGVGCVAGRTDELRGAAQQQQQPTGPNAPSIAASKKTISERTRMRSPACSIATRPIGVLNARGVFFGPEAPCSSSAQRSSLVPSYRHRAGSRSTSRGGTP